MSKTCIYCGHPHDDCRCTPESRAQFRKHFRPAPLTTEERADREARRTDAYFERQTNYLHGVGRAHDDDPR